MQARHSNADYCARLFKSRKPTVGEAVANAKTLFLSYILNSVVDEADAIHHNCNRLNNNTI